MKKFALIAIVIIVSVLNTNGQTLYFKNLTDSILNKYNADTNRISIKETDPLFKYKNYFNYVMCFYPKLEYKKIHISSAPSRKLAQVKVTILDYIAASEERVYNIKFSTKAPSLIDSITFENLSLNAKLALISKEISLIKVYSTSVFFEMISLRFKKNSVKNSKELNKDINLNSIEAGLGYQLMSYTNEVLSKLEEENWKDKSDYKKLYHKHTHALMSYDEIKTYMYDYPVYLQNIYK
jgi:hypothetical protein